PAAAQISPLFSTAHRSSGRCLLRRPTHALLAGAQQPVVRLPLVSAARRGLSLGFSGGDGHGDRRRIADGGRVALDPVDQPAVDRPESGTGTIRAEHIHLPRDVRGHGGRGGRLFGGERTTASIRNVGYLANSRASATERTAQRYSEPSARFT